MPDEADENEISVRNGTTSVNIVENNPSTSLNSQVNITINGNQDLNESNSEEAAEMSSPVEVTTLPSEDIDEVDGASPQVVVVPVPVTGANASSTSRSTSATRSGSRSRSRCPHRGNMLTRVRNLQSKHGQWTCFFCCHVTTGTVIIGAWDVLLNLLTLSILVFASFYPELLNTISPGHGRGVQNSIGRPRPYWYDEFSSHGVVQDVQAVNCTAYPCTMTNSAPGGGGRSRLTVKPHMAPDFPLAVGHRFFLHQINSEGVNVAVIITLCTLLVTLLLLYGVHRKHPSHLMPFFFLQVLDFCISSMTMVSYISYLPNLRQTLENSPPFPFKEDLLKMQTNCLTFFVLMIFIAVFIIKVYCINIVWRCYKYLFSIRDFRGTYETSDNNQSSLSGRQIQHGSRLTSSNAAPEHCMQWLLQGDSNGRGKVVGAYPEPPPSYDMAMASTYTEEGAAATTTTSERPPMYSPPAPHNSLHPTESDDSLLLPRYEDAIRQMPLQEPGEASTAGEGGRSRQ